MPPFVIEGVILRTSDFQERDRLITLYSEGRGKVRGVAKGAKASRRRFGANLDLLAHVRVHGFEKPNQALVRIDGVDLLDHYGGVRRDIRAFARACYLAEWTEGCTAERQPLPGLLSLILQVLSLLEARKGGEGLIRIFEIKLLDMAGYAPRLDRCVACGGTLDHLSRVRVRVERGGALCAACAPGAPSGLEVSLGALRVLQDARGAGMDRLLRIGFTAQTMAECRTLLRAFHAYHVGSPLRSLAFLEAVERGEADSAGRPDP
jgi:DNA repair protein RecO (recombination protein O)